VIVSIATALIAGTFFVTHYPGGELGESTMGRGALLFVVAIVLGVVAAIRVVRTKPA
jgi:hypothetical protein